MNEQAQIKAVAELDGWKYIKAGKDDFGVPYSDLVNRGHETILFEKLPPYLTSRDAIIPVIERQSVGIRVIVINEMEEIFLNGEFPTAAQLTEALLRATGKWIEE